jgi:O-antigen/teichoic acid export membrane protein
MPTKQIASSTLWQLASQVTMAALSILTVKFVAIGLTKELAGNYNSAYGYLQLFGILADFGLYAVGVREIARAKDRSSILSALIVIRFVVLILSLTLALVLVWILPQWRGTPLPLSVTIAALVPFFTLLAGILRTVFQVHYRMHPIFAAEVTQRVITTGLIGTFIAVGVRGSHDLQILHMFLFIGGIGAFTLFLISFVAAQKLERVRFTVDRSTIVSVLRQSLPFGIAFLCMAAYRQLDITLIALLRPDFEIQNAEYGFVLRMVDMGFIIPTFLLNSVLPTLSDEDARGGDTRLLLGRTFLTLLLLGIIAALFSVFWARPLIQLLTTDAYLSTVHRYGSDTALTLLGIPVLLNGIVQYGFYVLLNRGRWKPLVTVLALGAASSVALNITLIPTYGYLGSALTSNAVHIVLAIILTVAALRTMPIALPKTAMIRVAIFGVIFGVGLWTSRPLLTGEIPTVIALGLSTVVMGLLLWSTGIPEILQEGKTKANLI